MSEERKRILKMLAEGKISLDEADELLTAFQGMRDSSAGESRMPEPVARGAKAKPRYLRVQVLESDKEKVSVQVPLALLSAGIKFTSLIPEEARGKVQEIMENKGIPFNLNELKPESIDELIIALGELDIQVEDGEDRVRVFCE